MAGGAGSPTKRVEAETTNNSDSDGNDVALWKKSMPPPTTAFYIFMNDFRETYEVENPYVNLKDVPKLGGEKWKSFTEEEKKIYRDKAAQLMKAYNKSLESDDTDDEEKETDDAEEKQADVAVENREDAPNGGQTGRGRGHIG